MTESSESLPDMPPHKETPREWIRHELIEMGDLSAYTIPQLRDKLTPRVPIGHASYLVGPGLYAAIADITGSLGYTPNKTAREDGSRSAPLKKIEDMTKDEFIEHLQFRHSQYLNDAAATRRDAETWMAAHPGEALDVDELMKAGGW